MQVDAGEFIGKLRDRLALALSSDPAPAHADNYKIMAAFDRACVAALVEEHEDSKELTPQQRGARTRAANRQKKQRMENSGGPAPKGPVAVPANGATVEGGQ